MTNMPTSPGQGGLPPMRAQLFDLIGSMRVTQRGRAAAIMCSVAAEERGEREWLFLRLLVRGAHESAVGMGDDLVNTCTRCAT